jgi:cell wall assembly regulator SMI1
VSPDIRWIPALWDGHRPVPDGALEEAERTLDVSFPVDYRMLVLEHQGHAPEPGAFDFVAGTAKDVSVMGPLFHLLDEDESGDLAGYGLVAQAQHRWLPAGIVPICQDPAGNPIALDFRADRSEAQGVVFVEHEADAPADAVWPLASSLSALLARLHA